MSVRSPPSHIPSVTVLPGAAVVQRAAGVASYARDTGTPSTAQIASSTRQAAVAAGLPRMT